MVWSERLIETQRWSGRYRFPLALIVGNEVKGVSCKALASADKLVQIPMLGKHKSLNVASAAAVALYAIVSKTG